ncbi:DUF983 domain-containing protein [Aestuariivirga litoralis]|uniref:DUF983 domain-containing protein n=1 Tax=Aestuariivirga litoralis TaxID=2650924 RepID=UPI001FF0272F|nr:DUF983 domain-containing protein [Aestuariivirga litoralis]
MDENYYPDFSAAKTGMLGKCPRCARGKLFSSYLKVAKECSNCGLSYDFADAGDGAVWFVGLFACVVGVGSIFAAEAIWQPAYWVHALLGITLIIVAPLLLLQPVKGWLIAQQWRHNAHEGQLH